MSSRAVASDRPALRAVAAPPVAHERPARPVIRGRDPELDILGERLASVAAGHGGVLLVEGPPGIGKSTLLAEAERIAGRLGVRALCGPAFESQQTVPFAPLLAATLNSHPPIAPGDLARTLGGEPELGYWMLHELQGALEAAAAKGALAVILDDLQWADTGTLAALGSLSRHLSGSPILWIAARRSGVHRAPLRHAVAELQRAGARRLRLDALSDEAVAAVVADRLEAPADERLLALAAGAHGSPFLLAELLEGLREEGRLRHDAGRTVLVGEGLPRRMADSMRDRLDRLSGEARQVLRVAAVLGSRFSVRTLAAMLQRRPSTLVEALQEAVAADFFSDDGDALRFRHDLLRQGVLETLPGAVARALRREAATVLLEAGAAPAEVAARLAVSADVGDREAIDYLREAARSLAGSDAATAAALSERALALLPEADEQRGPLVAETVVLLHSAVRPDEARALGDGALAEVLPPEQEAEVRLSLSTMTMRPPATRAQENRHALELPGLPAALRARHQAWLAFNLASVDAGAAIAAARPALALAQDTGDVQAHVMATMGLVCVDCIRGRSVAALERIEALRGRTDRLPHVPCEPIVDVFEACVLADLGRVDEALALMAGGVAQARRQRNAWLLETWAQMGSALRLAAGQLGAARAEAESSDALVEQVAGGNFPGATALVTLAELAVHTGDAGLLRRSEAAARHVHYAGTPDVRRNAAWILALGAMARQDPADAVWWLTADGQEPYAVPAVPDDAGHEPTVARIAIAAGDRELAGRALATARARERENPGVAVIAATAAQTRGLLEGDSTALLDATRRLRGTQRPLLHAAAAEDAGRALGGEGRTPQAVALLREALDAFVACEAAGDAHRVRRLLRERGIRAATASRERPTGGWASLTDSELRVVRLVAEGATNRDAAARLFLSPHTVSSHLRHAFTKLHVNSRVELARLAMRHDHAASGAG